MLTRVVVRVMVFASVVAVGGVFGSARPTETKSHATQPAAAVRTHNENSPAGTAGVRTQDENLPAGTAAAQTRKELTPAEKEEVRRLFTIGNEALKAERFDDAITTYRQALAIDPDELSVFGNLSDALRQRGVKLWNEGARATDANVKAQSQGAAKKDWSEAAATALKALQLINSLAATSQRPLPPHWKTNATYFRALAMRKVATLVDKSQVDVAWNAYLDHIALLSDPAKKSEVKGEALQVLYGGGAYEKAALESRAVLKEEPDHPDATLVLGLSLYASRDKAKYAEARIYLQRYVDKTADTNPFKKGALRTLELLNKAEGSEQ